GLVLDLGPDLVADLGLALGPELARDLVPDFARRDRAASRRRWIGRARRNNRNSRDGGGGRRRSRPRTPPRPPQAATAPSTWVAAPLILAHDNARAAVGFATRSVRFPRVLRALPPLAAHSVRSPPPLAGEGPGGGTQKDSCWQPPPQPSPASGRGS